MTLFPYALDSDSELPLINDDLSNFEAKHINSLRDAIFAIEKALGTNIQGSLNNLSERLNIFFGNNGKPKSSELEELGLAPLPIQNKHVAVNAGIDEGKLALTHSTSNLYTLFESNNSQITSLTNSQLNLLSNFKFHLQGTEFLSDAITSARHTADQVDIVDNFLNYLGVNFDINNLNELLHSINNSLNLHQNSILEAHAAQAIVVNSENFSSIPNELNNAQEIFNYLDQNEILNMGQHRAVQHSSGITYFQRSESLLSSVGLGENIVPPTTAITYLVHNPNSSPVDNLSIGDDLIKFTPDNSNFIFDSQFSQVKQGDVITINYNNGAQSQFYIDSIRFIPGSEWIVKINGTNLYDTTNATVRIDRSKSENNSEGILAVSPVNIKDDDSFIYTDILTSLIIADPKSAIALGLDFDSGQINSTHYKLYLEFYPNGKPDEKTIKLPFIDVSGNQGLTPGQYSLQSIVQNVNNQFRRIGYNYRFIAFEYNGNFGLSIADSINNASFAIIKGSNSSGTLEVGEYTENIIGGNNLDSFDALGFGSSGINIASPAYQGSWSDSTAALIPTKIISPKKHRYYYVNGLKKDSFAKTYLSNEDGYWDGYISARTPLGNFNVEVTYTINLDLRQAELKPGKTLIIQPHVNFNDSLYLDVDYGRFVIKEVNFDNCSGSFNDKTTITVVNGIHAIGNGFAESSVPSLPVKIYFGYDSVGFNNQNVIDSSSSSNNYIRWHEIYINDLGKTFAHERLRFVKQSETNSLLNSSNWHILNVSSKLRGYQGSNPEILNKYIRFFVKDYNQLTGEYDGYLGKISGSSIVQLGPIIHSKKNIPTKFYDETNIDYVELIFEDNSSSPGNNIASSISGRYIDFELFYSLQNQEELLFLAGCEVNWAPDIGQNTVAYINDMRQVGSVGVLDLNNSSKEYISAVDRYVHQNGIIRGLDLDSISSVLDSGEIYFKGGLVLINGHVVQVNNSSVTIPRIYEQGGTLPQNIDWCICVNENGNLVSVLLSDQKEQYFASTGSDHYLLPSYTFYELINIRKDLVPIRKVVATISSLTISSTTDLRKFILYEDLNQPLIFASSNDIGNFNTIEPLKEWINKTNGSNCIIYLKGIFTLNENDSPINLTGFSKNVIFDGSNSSFNIYSSKGIIIGDNITLKNCTFNYYGDNAIYTSGRLLNVEDGNACIVNVLGNNLSNLNIENCIFNTEEEKQRPPFIFIQLNKGNICKNINIVNNKFYDSGNTYFYQSQAAIAIWTTNSGAEIYPALAKNVNITNNICNELQGIYISTKSGTTGAETPGINAINCLIANNLCGIIGFVTSNVISSLSEISDFGSMNGLTISNNTCSIIANLFHYGDSVLDPNSEDISYGRGNTIIENNKVHWICVQDVYKSASYRYSSLQIKNNILEAFDSTYLDLFIFDIPNYGIYVSDLSSTEASYVTISGNHFQFGRFNDTDYSYEQAIHCDASSVISENIIRGLAANASGIVALGTGGNGSKRYNIHDNQIYRGSTSIAKYIYFPASGTKVFGICVNNFFDSPTIDGSSEAVIYGLLDQIHVDKNINQSVNFSASASSGRWGTGTSSPLLFGDGSIVANDTTTGLAITQSSTFYSRIRYDSSIATEDRFPTWTIQLDEVLPKGVHVVYIEAELDASTTFTTSDFTLSLIGTGLATLTQDGGAPTSISTSGATLELTTPSKFYLVNSSIRPIVKLSGEINMASGGGIIDVLTLTIKYRW